MAAKIRRQCDNTATSSFPSHTRPALGISTGLLILQPQSWGSGAVPPLCHPLKPLCILLLITGSILPSLWRQPLSPRLLHPSTAIPLPAEQKARGPDILLHISTNLTQIFLRDGSAGHCVSRACPAAGWSGGPLGCPCPSLGCSSPSVAVHLAALGCLGSWSLRSARKAATAASAFPHVGIFSSAVH